MASDQAGVGADEAEEVEQDEERQEAARRMPSDRPGDPGYPSRAESRRAVMELSRKSAEASAETADESNPADDPKLSSETPEKRREQNVATEDEDTSAMDRQDSQGKPEPVETQPGRRSERVPLELADAETSGSVLEQMPSYGSFANMAEEFDARNDSRELVQLYNTDLAKDRPDEASETKISETSQDRSNVSPETRDGDEPGSWRGEGGQYLNVEENIATDHALDRVQKKEPEITEDLKAVESDTGGRLVGLDHRLKGEDRFKEKVAAKTREEPELSIGDVTEHQHDAIRYTYQFGKEDYVRGYEGVKRQLESRGYELMLARNSWDSRDYKGVNTRWTAPEGQLFEVQFHTSESFAAKQETHKAYERLRTPGISREEHEQLRAYQREVTARISAPSEVNKIENYRKG